MKRRFLYAPGVWTGGGRVLLAELLKDGQDGFTHLLLDQRFIEVEGVISALDGQRIRILSNTLLGRVSAELRLWAAA